MNEVWLRGQRATLTVTLKDASGTVVAPTAITAEVKDPTGAVTTPTPTNVSTGVYTLGVDLDLAGTYWVRFETTGTKDVQEVGIVVRQGEFS